MALVKTLDVADGEGMMVCLVDRASQMLEWLQSLVPELSRHLLHLERDECFFLLLLLHSQLEQFDVIFSLGDLIFLPRHLLFLLVLFVS